MHRWPRVRRHRNGARTISGWYTVQWRFALLRRATRWGVVLAGAALMVMAALPMFAEFGQRFDSGGMYWRVLRALAWFRRDVGQVMLDHVPEFAEWLGVDPTLGYSWTLAVGGAAAWLLINPLTAGLSRLLALVAPCVVKGRVKVHISARDVRFRRWGWPQRYRRRPGVPVQFLVEQTNQYAHSPQPPSFPRHRQHGPPQTPRFRTVMRYGHRKILMRSSMHQRDAERLALGLSYARDQADGVSVMPGLDPAMAYAQ